MIPHRLPGRALFAGPAPDLLLPTRGIQWLLARSLRHASRGLARAARLLAPRPLHRALPPPADLPLVEYHGHAAAPEGALYVNGEFIGRLDVPRL